VIKEKLQAGIQHTSFKKSLCDNLMTELISVHTGTPFGLKFVKTDKSTHLCWFYTVYRKG